MPGAGLRRGYFEFGPETMARSGAAYSLDLEQRMFGTEGRSRLTSRWEAPRPRLTEAAREKKSQTYDLPMAGRELDYREWRFSRNGRGYVCRGEAARQW